MSFNQKCIVLLKRIPKGKVTTYKALAKAAGNVKATRAVGNAMHHNEHPKEFPCYKVVASDGSLGGYTHKLGLKKKIQLLKKDGIAISKSKKIDLKKYGYFF